ncbi:MAG: TM2 domain-containing protein [Balneolaceae bacterium]
MRKSEKHELIIVAAQALDRASQKYEEIMAELKEAEDYKDSNLSITIHDSIKNLSRKIEAYQKGLIDQNKLVDEYIFEYESVDGESEIEKEVPVRLKRLTQRLLSSYKNFIEQVGGRKKVKRLEKQEPDAFKAKSVKKAYLFWLIGFFGILGFHRFYLGKPGTGIGWMFTGGLLGFGAIYDLIALPKMVDEENFFIELKAAKLKQLSGR